MGATAFPAAAIVSGTIATPRLGSGTADATSFLRGDSTWAVVPEVTRASLGLATTDSPTFAGATLTGGLKVSQGTVGVNTASIINTSYGDFGINFSANNKLAIGQLNAAFGWAVVAGIGHLVLPANSSFSFASSNTAITGQGDALLWRDAANTLGQRNGTNGQKSRIYKTYTSATSGEWLELDAATDASNFDLAACIGSAGGDPRGIRIGGKNAAGTFTSWLSFATSGAATFSGTLQATSVSNPSALLTLGNATHGVILAGPSNFSGSMSQSGLSGLKTVSIGYESDYGMIRSVHNGVALKPLHLQSSVTRSLANGGMQVRNLADSADAPITASNITASGALQIGNAAVAETPVATHTLIIKDSTGTSYRVLAVAV